MFCTILGAISGLSSAGLTTIYSNLPWWQALLIACIPPVLGFIFDWLRKKFKINVSKDTEKKIIDKVVDTATDLADDRKLNNSNKKGDQKDETNRKS